MYLPLRMMFGVGNIVVGIDDIMLEGFEEGEYEGACDFSLVGLCVGNNVFSIINPCVRRFSDSVLDGLIEGDSDCDNVGLIEGSLDGKYDGAL